VIIDKEYPMALVCNLSDKDRVSRVGFGIFLLIALAWSKEAAVAVAVVMIVEGFIGWCGLATFVDSWKKRPPS
jgi:hypothetical protein